MFKLISAARRDGARGLPTPCNRHQAIRGTAALAIAMLAAQGGAAWAKAPLHDALGAPEKLTIEGSIRSRVEVIDGQFRPNAAEDDFLWSLKTTLHAEYDSGPLRIGGELWDARGYGQKKISSAGTGEVNALELVQAYVGVDVGLGDATAAALTAGRFTMDVGSRRLVARQTFRNTSNAFTGVNLVLTGKGGDAVKLFWTMPQIRLPDAKAAIRDNKGEWDHESDALQFFGGSVAKGGVLGGTLEAYSYGLREKDSADRATRNRRLTTQGIRAYRKPAAGAVDYDVEGAYQYGETRASAAATDHTDLDVSAYFIHAELGHTWAKGWRPRASVDFDLGSGDKAGSRSYNRFDTLYGSRRSDFGPTGLYGPGSRSNMVSGGVRLELKPAKTTDVMAMYRALWLDSKTDAFANTGVKDAAGVAGRFAGHQFEMRVRHWLVPDMVRIDTGLAYFAKRRFLTDAANAPQTGDTRYGYFDLSLAF